MTRILAIAFVAALLRLRRERRGQAARKAHAKGAVAELAADGEPDVQSSGVLVLDPTTGQTLFAKNADQAAPIASITKLMTAMVVLDAKLPLDEAIEITADDIDHDQEHASRACPIGSALPARRPDAPRAHGERQPRGRGARTQLSRAGSPAFVDAMNAKAQALGLSADALRGLLGALARATCRARRTSASSSPQPRATS